jgi:hypothetical protein
LRIDGCHELKGIVRVEGFAYAARVDEDTDTVRVTVPEKPLPRLVTFSAEVAKEPAGKLSDVGLGTMVNFMTLMVTVMGLDDRLPLDPIIVREDVLPSVDGAVMI